MNRIAQEAKKYTALVKGHEGTALSFVSGAIYIFNRICGSGLKEGATVETVKAEADLIRAELNEIQSVIKQKQEITKQTGLN